MTGAAASVPMLRIALESLGEITTATVSLAIERFGRGEFVLAPAGDADALVIDADRLSGKDGFAAFRREHAEIPLVIMSSSGLTDGNGITLNKPVAVGHLVDALRALRNRIVLPRRTEEPAVAATAERGVAASGSLRGDSPAAAHARSAGTGTTAARRSHSADPGARRVFGFGEVACAAVVGDILPERSTGAPAAGEISFDPDKGLLGVLRQAAQHVREHGRVVAISGLPGGLYIDRAPPFNAVTDLGSSAVRAVCFARGASENIRYYTIAALPQSARSHRRFPLESLVWSVALWSSCGRLPAECDPYAATQLGAWPNFTRLAVPPHGLRIAARWVTRPAAPVAIASELRIPQSDAFAFCSAAWALNLFINAPRDALPAAADQPAADATVAVADRGLLSRILGRLFHAH